MSSMAWIFAIALVAGFVRGEPLVKSSLGAISGKVESFEGLDVESFLGIPYAKPPVGDLRFAHPRAFGPVGELNATEFSAVCKQPSRQPRFPSIGSEDCLYLNVFRKSGTQQDAKKAVLFVIHGDGFTTGSASEGSCNPVPMTAMGDVIVVSINYRLGIFGFADMKDLAPGNIGFYDQLMALEWVRDNIAAFGGDPQKVTLFGVSAGSVSISALLMTPLVRGENLFKQVVMDAGVMSRTTVMTQEESLKRLKGIAARVGCKTEGEKMLRCLRKADATKLAALSYDSTISPVFSFLPTVDGKFLTLEPSKNILENSEKFADVRMIIGFAKNEGSMFALMYPSAPMLRTEAEFLALSERISRGFYYRLALDRKEIKDAILQTYFGKSANRISDVAEFIGDGSIKCPLNAFVKKYAKTHRNVFVYEFKRVMEAINGQSDPNFLGAFHGSPFIHMLGSPLADNANSGDSSFIKDSVRMLSDFVKFNDTPQLRGVTWPNYSKGEGVLLIDDKSTVATSIPNHERCQKVFSFLEKA